MGKRLIVQRRGKGSIYRAPSHRYVADVRYPAIEGKGVVKELMNDPARTAPLARVEFPEGIYEFIAPEGIGVGDEFIAGELSRYSVLKLRDVPEGSAIFNIEVNPLDGGKLIRSAGTYALLVSKDERSATIKLPSGKFKQVSIDCRATTGIAAGGGRKEKPVLKAGKKKKVIKNKPKVFPKVRGVAKNPVDHPFGGGAHQHPGKPKTPGRNASPGRKIGSVAAKRTGKR
ncbi:MAG: 50S ribosomal protein L2 [Candidatus Thermoplasmatota archaeon]|nr:50S ribosomal protein L2 [Candidatus Thermoplasmatota archaeon]